MIDQHGTGRFEARPNRCSIRLKGYDYSQAGAYFITICTKDRACLFGEVVNGEMRLNDFGQVVHSVWNNLPNHYAGIAMDAFVVMPNHVHGIVIIVGAGLKPAPITTAAPATTAAPTQHGLPEIIRGFKTFSARRINELRGTPGVPIWQRNYYEHIIRNEESLHRIRQYILDNPARWVSDRENPAASGLKDEWAL
ncbi:MAG: hypothetical protein KatS3mg026_0258 [Bacteroidia bacterium]|nr:MAG: hypothetical protein KatS3mg026_0258 [Bacteroidia bacterium]